MSKNMNKDAKPDVEQIISQIRQNIIDSEKQITPEMDHALNVENDIYGNLAMANETCHTGKFQAGGPILRLRRRFMSPLINEVNQFNAHIIRVLNRLIKMIDGTDTESESQVLENAGRRMDLISSLSHRLADVEQRLDRIEDKKEK